jgi:mevalonate kinase
VLERVLSEVKADVREWSQAPGKVILFGEHAVVYGEPAVGMPLSRGARVRITPGTGRVSIVTAPSIRVTPSKRAASPKDLVARALGDAAPMSDVTIELGFPPMAGFGSSAAIAIALLRARQRRWSNRSLLEAAIEIERVAHAKPSGVDPAICLWGGPIVYRNTDRGRQIRRLERPRARAWLVVASAGAHGGTMKTVTRLAELRRSEPRLIRSAMAALGETSRVGARSLETGDLTAAGYAMDLAHGVLSGLGLVSLEVDTAVRLARRSGALGAKMSGAGGAGGALIALAPDRSGAERIERKLAGAPMVAWTERL